MHHQHQGVHALVARDVDGRKMIELLKRDDAAAWSDNMRSFIHRPQHNTNSESIKLNVPADFTEKDTTNNNNSDSNNGVATAVSVVYVTMSPTFSGSILGYVTATPDSSTSTNIVDASSAVPSTSAANVVNTLSSTATAGLLSSITPPAPSVGTPVAVTQAASSIAASSTPVSDASSQQNVSVSQQQNNGLTDGAKAGVAIGVLLALALAAALFFFCWKRAKKNNTHEEYNEKSAINEKRNSFFGGAATGAKRASADSDKSFGTLHNTATAPRLSLRPVTQFLPGFGEKRKSSNPLAAGPSMSEKPSSWERRPVPSENPFNDAQHSDKQADPFVEGDGRSMHSHSSSDSAKSVSGPAAVVAGQEGASAQRAPNNVHRVQLDFKPSMDDELELKSGQLVRMLHEYDDGWALCVRMDRSQQGVAPRTCLSKTPVKPRGPPPGGRVSPQGNPSPITPQQQTSPVARKPVPGQAI